MESFIIGCIFASVFLVFEAIFIFVFMRIRAVITANKKAKAINEYFKYINDVFFNKSGDKYPNSAIRIRRSNFFKLISKTEFNNIIELMNGTITQRFLSETDEAYKIVSYIQEKEKPLVKQIKDCDESLKLDQMKLFLKNKIKAVVKQKEIIDEKLRILETIQSWKDYSLSSTFNDVIKNIKENDGRCNNIDVQIEKRIVEILKIKMGYLERRSSQYNQFNLFSKEIFSDFQIDLI